MNSQIKYRVLEDRGTSFVLTDENGRIWPGELSGKFKSANPLSLPTTGDWVSGSIQPGEWIYIDSVYERKNVLVRQSKGSAQRLGANIDWLFIATSAERDFNLNRLDRYVAMAYSFGISPVIVITKIEECESPAAILDEACERFPFVDIHAISTLESINLESLDRYLETGNTVAIMGSSGVGKSTLVNHLLGNEVLVTGAVRESDGRGRHTTTGRSLHRLPSGAWLMDTPGIRALSLFEGEVGLSHLFEDIDELAHECKFSDCKHESEPRCRIREALALGEICEERWQSYLKLQAENAHERRRHDKAEASKHKAMWKKISLNAQAEKKFRSR